MTELDREAVAAIRMARITVLNAKWHICEEQAVERLARVYGLACTPLFPGHPVIQVVACDGRLLGRARRHHGGHTARWVAVPVGSARETGTYRTLHGAARALARHHGIRRHRVTDCRAFVGSATATVPSPWFT
ncbi:hypothetical protein [Streptomyces sp. 6-11-2]|uniref:hypothetical protein n=1 Tax=Streptomyces sp. 6-11-2 TaxID=2585753 RepID=UPI0011432DDC|nr:hypothetical protein [Streptomyces sp. 6-11-2]GED89602.1 hypothetical protein TNCT6_66870 [Streptomyces sp. 6-11-2]